MSGACKRCRLGLSLDFCITERMNGEHRLALFSMARGGTALGILGSDTALWKDTAHRQSYADELQGLSPAALPNVRCSRLLLLLDQFASSFPIASHLLYRSHSFLCPARAFLNAGPTFHIGCRSFPIYWDWVHLPPLTAGFVPSSLCIRTSTGCLCC